MGGETTALFAQGNREGTDQNSRSRGMSTTRAPPQEDRARSKSANGSSAQQATPSKPEPNEKRLERPKRTRNDRRGHLSLSQGFTFSSALAPGVTGDDAHA